MMAMPPRESLIELALAYLRRFDIDMTPDTPRTPKFPDIDRK